MKKLFICCSATALLSAASCGNSNSTADPSKDSLNESAKTQATPGTHTISAVTLSGTPTEIPNTDLLAIAPAGWSFSEPSVWGDDKGIVSFTINRGEESFGEVSIEKTGKESLYTTFAEFQFDYAGNERAVLKADSTDLNGITSRKFIAYQDLDEEEKPTNTGFALQGYYSDRRIVITSFGEDAYSDRTIDSLIAITYSFRVK